MANNLFQAAKVGYEDLTKRHHWAAVLLSGLLALLLFWLFFALEPLFTFIDVEVARGLFGSPPDGDWNAGRWAIGQALLPALLFIGTLLLFWWRYRHKRVKTNPDLMMPEAHKGLIFMISKYYCREGKEKCGELKVPATAEALIEALNAEPSPPSIVNAAGSGGGDGEAKREPAKKPNVYESLRRCAFASTWGTLWAAAEHHRRALQHCWLVCTTGESGTEDLFEAAQRLVQAAAFRKVKCYCVLIPDAYDVGEIVAVIDDVYRELPPGLNADDVIADFTGGTAAMTAGMVLATLDRQRKIQYLRQDKALLRGDERWPLAQEEIEESQILAMVRTWPELVRISE